MPKPNIDAIRQREAAATPGPWRVGNEDPKFKDVLHSHELIISHQHGIVELEQGKNGAADTAFIANARQDVPALLAEVEHLRREVETLRSVAQSNKRHVAENVAILERVEALTKDTDGGEVDADAEIPVGEIRRALYEPVRTTGSKLTQPSDQAGGA